MRIVLVIILFLDSLHALEKICVVFQQHEYDPFNGVRQLWAHEFSIVIVSKKPLKKLL